MDISNNLHAEVAQFKRDLKRQRWTNMGLLMCGLLGFGALSARTQDVASTAPQDLVVRSLKVVGPDGTERISLKAGEHYGDIRIISPQQHPQVVLSSNAFGGTVCVLNNSGRPSGVLQAGDGGIFTLFTKSEKHHKGQFPAIALEANEQDSRLSVYDYQGNALAELPERLEQADGD